ncbi:hypothetical protein AB0C13_29050 [Streptomyces sp. NPDC049099]|uniref:hypothetical protein n=1 Tax=Streptomyces sp. NPDC049099 TaxID=3155768 RepID=UPI0034147AD3
MLSTVRSSFALAATTLALTGGLAVAGPGHVDAHGAQSATDRASAVLSLTDASAASSRKIRIRGTQVALRECPRTSCRVDTRVSHTTVRAYCQINQRTSKVSGNKWWTKVTLLSGSDPAWVSNHYVHTAAPKVPRLPSC